MLSVIWAWYRLPDVFRMEHYQVIVQIAKELRIAAQYLGDGQYSLKDPALHEVFHSA